jgi:DNA-binding transcriptional ArsR family regulator
LIRSVYAEHVAIVFTSTFEKGSLMPSDISDQEAPLLPDDVPVEMPELPHQLIVTDPEQYKAMGDKTRTRIVRLVQHKPMTVKQMATQLGLPPGTVGHHVQILEAAGLLKVVARRLVRGIVAKYYARTARIFLFDFQDKGVKDLELHCLALQFLDEAHEEIREAIERLGDDFEDGSGFPHARIARERMEYYRKRLHDLFEELIAEPHAPDGVVVGLFGVIFTAPPLATDQTEEEEK